jgi:ADP-ribosylglycohydrolase
MLGAILGDIVGSPYEFDHNNYKHKDFPLLSEKSHFTDDTVMTVAVAVIFLARTGHSKPEIKRYVEQTFGYDLNCTCDEIRPTYHHVETCQQTVPEAIIAFLESVSFEDALRNAVSLGGDSDTLACITGGIAEAFYGMPQELRDETLKRLPEDIREGYELLCFMIAKMI